ncbi:MAG: SWIM zinc finger family protein [Nitrososphaerota archaeon]|nr:SWIM zinc finger family protein [Nitrososphaerota archaeon]
MNPTAERIRELCTEESFKRGVEYYKEGRVHDIRLSGERATSLVHGTRTYRVEVRLGEKIEGTCTCPYDFEGYCKHIVATLLAISKDRAGIEESTKGDQGRLKEAFERSTERRLKDFLEREFDRDEALRDRFLIYMDGEGGIGGRSVSDYRKEVARLYEAAMGRYGAIEYGTEVDFSPFFELAKRHAERGNFEEAARVYQALSEVIAENMDVVDDSDGYYGGEFQSALDGFASAISGASLDHKKKAPYIEYFFRKYIARDPDYFQENYEAALESICTTREDLLYWKGLLGPHLPSIVPDPKVDWSKHYEAEQLVLMQAYILDRLGDERSTAELYDLFRRHYRDDETFCVLYVGRLDKDGRKEDAVRVAEEGLKLFPPHLTLELRHFLDGFYEENDPEKYRENLMTLFYKERDWKHYDRLKRAAGPDWGGTLRDMMDHLLSADERHDAGTSTIIEMCLREGMYDRALELVLSSKSLGTLDRYYGQLSERYPREYFHAYEELVPRYAEGGMGRDHYRQIVRELKMMKGIKGFKAEFDLLLRRLRERHARKPAFLDELRRL